MSHQVPVNEKYERNGWPSVARPDLKPPDGWSLELINSINLVHHHSLSPDGRAVAFVWERDGRSDIYVQQLSGGWPRRISHDRRRTIYWWDSAPQWSPDGRWLAFAANGQVFVAPSDGRGTPRAVTDFGGGAWSPVWMPDSARLIVSATRGETTALFLTDVDGRWPRVLVADSTGDCMDPSPAPEEGAAVAFSFRPLEDLNRWEIRMVDVDTGRVRPITGDVGEKDWSPLWRPENGLLTFLSQRSGYTEIWQVLWDGSERRQLTELRRDVLEFAWSPDRTQLAATVSRDGALDLVLIDAATGRAHDLVTGSGCFGAPRWSPDGRFLTVEYETATTPPDIFHVDVAESSGQMTQLTFSTPPALAALDRVTPEHLYYPVPDERIEAVPALLWRPARPNGAAIIRPHGGPADAYRFQWDGLAQYFLAKGYTFFTPNFRGSSGYGRKFEHANYNDWGVGDTQDVLHGARFLHTQGIDPARIGILGSSYGGYLVACCLSRDPDHLFACGVSKNGDANVYTSWAQCERTTRLYTEMMIGHPRDNWGVYQAASPIHQMHNVRAPILLLHGLADDVVPPQASEEWAEALRRHDKVYEYKTYAGEPHGFLRPETDMDWMRRTERFFDWYLRP